MHPLRLGRDDRQRWLSRGGTHEGKGLANMGKRASDEKTNRLRVAFLCTCCSGHDVPMMHVLERCCAGGSGARSIEQRGSPCIFGIRASGV